MKKRELKYVFLDGLPGEERELLEKLFPYVVAASRKKTVLTDTWDGKEEFEARFADGKLFQERGWAARELEGMLGESGIVISSDQGVLDAASENNIASIAYQPADGRGTGGEGYLRADMAVEGFEEVDRNFLQRVFERHHGIPWTILETKRCVLREFAMEDLDGLFELYSYEGMTDFMEDLYGYEEEREYQRSNIRYMYRFYGYGMWLVFEKGTGRLIGRAGLEMRKELGGRVELGYAIGTPFQRKGYATEVCTAILAYAKEELGFSSVCCLIREKNEVSMRLAEKLGFTFRDVVAVNGVFMHHYEREL